VSRKKTTISAKKGGTAIKHSARAVSAAVDVISPFQLVIKIEITSKQQQPRKFDVCGCQPILGSSSSTLASAVAFLL